MEHVEDVTPGQFRHVWIPNETYDDLERNHLVAVAVLIAFLRHSASYGITLTKLIARAAGVGKAVLSTAYNVLIDRGYLVRIDFGHTAPSGSKAQANQRHSVTCVSRVPISDDTLAELIKRYTPGKHVLINWSTGETNEYGREVYERRRVTVVSAEIYMARGAMKIHKGELLSLHAKAHGAFWRDKNAELGKRYGFTSDTRFSIANAPQAGEEGEPANPQVAPEGGNLTSGATCGNTPNPQVAPEGGNPPSIKNKEEKDQEKDQAARALAALGCAPDEPDGPARTEPQPATPDRVAPKSARVGNPPPVRAHVDVAGLDNDGKAMSREEAAAVIRAVLAGRTPHTPPETALNRP